MQDMWELDYSLLTLSITIRSLELDILSGVSFETAATGITATNNQLKQSYNQLLADSYTWPSCADSNIFKTNTLPYWKLNDQVPTLCYTNLLDFIAEFVKTVILT